jgi:N-acetylmuramoyl-L-alanine amidase
MNMIPVRDAAKVFNCAVTWEEATRTAYLEGYGLLEPGGTFYDQADLLWIARIVRHESGNQILDGKVAVANVILNRMGNPGFPNTAEEVIFDTRTGVQFVTRESTKIYIEPSEECFLAAKLAMEGYETAPDCFYFVSVKSAEKSWAGRNRTFYGIIEGHAFYL